MAISRLFERALTKADFPGPLPPFPYFGWYKPDDEVDLWSNPIYMHKAREESSSFDYLFSRVHPSALDSDIFPGPQWLDISVKRLFDFVKLAFSGRTQPKNTPWNFLNPYYLYIEGAVIRKDDDAQAVMEWTPLPVLYAGLSPIKATGGEVVEGPGFWTDDPLKTENPDSELVFSEDFLAEHIGVPERDRIVALRIKAVQLLRALSFGSVNMVQNINAWHIEDMHGRIIKLEENKDPRTAAAYPYIGKSIMRENMDKVGSDDAANFPKLYDSAGRCSDREVYNDLFCIYGEDRIAVKSKYDSSRDIDILLRS